MSVVDFEEMERCLSSMLDETKTLKNTIDLLREECGNQKLDYISIMGYNDQEIGEEEGLLGTYGIYVNLHADPDNIGYYNSKGPAGGIHGECEELIQELKLLYDSVVFIYNNSLSEIETNYRLLEDVLTGKKDPYEYIERPIDYPFE